VKDEIAQAAERFAAEAGVSADKARELAEECPRAAAALGMCVADLVNRMLAAVRGVELAAARGGRELLDTLRPLLEHLKRPATQHVEPAPSLTTGWQIGGIRAARRNRLRRR
jgi:hypothetical protein